MYDVPSTVQVMKEQVTIIKHAVTAGAQAVIRGLRDLSPVTRCTAVPFVSFVKSYEFKALLGGGGEEGVYVCRLLLGSLWKTVEQYVKVKDTSTLTVTYGSTNLLQYDAFCG